MIAIDSKSVEAIGRWPWSRTVHAELIDRLRELGASTVAFDLLFSERQGEREAERLRAIEETLPVDAEVARAEVAAALDEVLIDQRFSAAMERTFDDDAAWTVLGFDFVLPEDLGKNRQLPRLLSDDEEQIILDIASYPSRDQNIPGLHEMLIVNGVPAPLEKGRYDAVNGVLFIEKSQGIRLGRIMTPEG